MRRLPLLLLLPALFLLGCPDEAVEPIVIQLPGQDLSAADFTLQLDASATAVQAGEAVTFTYRLLDWNDEDVTAQYTLRTDISPALGYQSQGDGSYLFTKVDDFTFFVSVDVLGTTLVEAAQVSVSPGEATQLAIDADRPLVEAGQVVTMTAEITDAFGNEAPGDVTYSVTPSAAVAGNEITPTLLGSYTVTGTLVGTSATATDGFTVESSEPISLDISLSSYDVERGDGIQVYIDMRDQFGNQVDFPVELSTDLVGAETWGTFVRFNGEGIFTIFAEVPTYGLSAQDGPVLVDSTGPSIRVTTPQRGVELDMDANPTVLVTGSVTDPWTGVTALTINGSPSSLLPGGLFEFSMSPERGLNGLDIVAVDGDGNVSDHYQTFLWGEFLPVNELNDDGILARMNQEAIDVLEDFIANGLDTSSLFDSFNQNLWTSPEYCVTVIVSEILEVCGQLLIDVTGISFGGMEFDLDPNNPNGTFPKGYLDFAADLQDLEIIITLTGAFHGEALFGLITFDESVSMDAVFTADHVLVDTNAGFVVNASNEIEVILDQTVVNVINLELDLPDLGFLGDIFGGLFNLLWDIFEPLFNLLLGPIVESQLPGLLQGFLGALEIETEIDMLGTPLTIAALPGQICIDDDGMTIGLDSSASAPAGPNAPATLGSYMRSDYELPQYGPTPAFSISLADNFVNQLLHAVWQAGVIDFSMDSSELGLDLASIGDFLPLTEISFETVPMLPPVVGPGATGLMEMGLGDMLVNVYGDPGGTYGLMMQLAVSLTADMDLSIDSDNLIQFGLGDPAITMEFVTSDWPELDGEVAENLMDAVVDLIIPTVTGALDELGGIPIPELPGFGLGAASIEREADPAFYISAEGDLVLIP